MPVEAVERVGRSTSTTASASRLENTLASACPAAFELAGWPACTLKGACSSFDVIAGRVSDGFANDWLDRLTYTDREDSRVLV